MYYDYSDLNYINQELAGVWPGWTAVKLLGRGSFGAVYEIHRNVRGTLEKAAMKVLRVPENDAEIARLEFHGVSGRNTEEYYEALVDGIQNEIRIMQRFVGNSHIVSYEDYAIRKRPDQIGWDLYLRMELLNGLTYYMKSSTLSEQMIVKLGMDIAQGLRDCHNSGIIHRDVKPENIFVNESGDFKLGDFGVSRSAPGSQDMLSFKGTFGYMAPEVFKMLSTDGRSDLYSLGMVLYQCLNDNRLPFVSEKVTPYEIETARQRRFAGEPIPEPAHGSPRLKSIVLRALEEKPENRFQNAEEMYSALMEVYRTESASERRILDGASQENFIPSQNTQYRQVSKKPFPLIPIVAACVAVIIIAAAGISALLINRADIFESGQAAQIAETSQIAEVWQSLVSGQMGQGGKGESVIGSQKTSAEADEEQKGDYAIDWKDPALETKMRAITGITSGEIKYSDLQKYGYLDLTYDKRSGDDVQIQDISALSCMPNLKDLKLGGNSISDISALSSLTNLTALVLTDNNISDISSLANLSKLENLHLDGNTISDISALANLSNLERLYLEGNAISNLNEISGLVNLKVLKLHYNGISDISSLRSLTNLTLLELYNNQISDISALSGLTNLKRLGLSYNQIRDISALSNLTNLTELFLSGNRIDDLSALSGLSALKNLSLDQNQISDISALSGLTNLKYLDLKFNPIVDYSPIEGLNIIRVTK